MDLWLTLELAAFIVADARKRGSVVEPEAARVAGGIARAVH